MHGSASEKGTGTYVRVAVAAWLARLRGVGLVCRWSPKRVMFAVAYC